MKLIFYYEYKDLIGGLTSLYITIFEQLIHERRPFVFFNYKDGIVARELRKKGIEITPIDIDTFDWNLLNTVVGPDDVLVTTSFDECLYRFMKINPRIMYYVVHEFIGEISKYKFGFNRRKSGHRLVALLDEKKPCW